ncbi:hypothetical protein SAMN05421881_104721 [Nitrosomonas halophila]|uniref:Uncharacterized protein n=1 Tax=Nitrosomonas halophila TaxID=44576 RepID=A0A1H3LD02_9PROT|nr:hypothetical protein SAMN05421881_104721 [Nitrosomonas halophila]
MINIVIMAEKKKGFHACVIMRGFRKYLVMGFVNSALYTANDLHESGCNNLPKTTHIVRLFIQSGIQNRLPLNEPHLVTNT